MTCEEPMDVEDLDATNGHSSDINKNELVLRPVLPGEAGEGLPYAPVDFPGPGDIWGWRVGKRTNVSGYYMDRYLYPPVRLRKSERVKGGFASKLSAEHYIRAKFPDANIDAFFSSFSWRIPSKHTLVAKDLAEEHVSFSLSSEDTEDQSLSDIESVATVCKAGNRHCRSLTDEMQLSHVALMPCDICCSEPNFCRDCCCILCCKPAKLNLGGYGFITCEATIPDGGVCGHVAHVNCALRSYMAGTVGGSIGLDAEYYCRRCDSRTDLMKHVTKIIRTCNSTKSEEDVQKMLKLSVCILRGTQKENARRVLHRVELALQKLRRGYELKDIWELEEDPSTSMTGEFSLEPSPRFNVVVTYGAGQDNPPDSGAGMQNGIPAVTTIMDREIEYLKVEKEIDQVLLELRNSQNHEYRIAQERLHAQKDCIFSLYEQLDQLKSVSERHVSGHDEVLSAIAEKEEQIKLELDKLKDMEMVAKGFGRMPQNILTQHFDLGFEE